MKTRKDALSEARCAFTEVVKALDGRTFNNLRYDLSIIADYFAELQAREEH